MTLTELCTILNIKADVSGTYDIKTSTTKWTASLVGALVRNGSTNTNATGHGEDADEAVSNLCELIEGKRILVEGREYTVPTNLDS